MIEGSKQIETSVNKFIETLEKNSNDSLGWIFQGLKNANKAFHKITRSEIASSYQEKMICVKSIESSLTSYQDHLEEYFYENNIRVHHDWVFSKENRKTINELTGFIKNCTKNLKKIPYHKIWQYCIAFSSIQKIARQVIWKAEIQHDNKFENSVVEMKYFCKYAIAIYGKLLVRVLIENKWGNLIISDTEDLIFCKYVKINEELLIYSQMLSRKFIPCHTISVDHNKKAIVVSIRGTMSLFDCMTDLKSEYIPYTFVDYLSQENIVTGSVHSGILQSALNINAEILPIIHSCIKEWPNYSIIIVGHSLGAGTASLLGLLWIQKEEFAVKNLKVYAYGPPPVVSHNLNVYLQSFVYSCIYGNDIIGRLSLGSIKDLAEMIRHFYRKELESSQLNAADIATNWLHGDKENSLDMINLYRDLKEAFTQEKLVPPGNIFQMYRTQLHSDYLLISEQTTEAVIGKFIASDFYNEIVIDKSSLLDHMPNAYEEAINICKYLNED